MKTKKQTILIVEDELVNRKILYHLLYEKYDVLEAENGWEAFDIIMSGQYTIMAILLDLIMPVTNGYEFMRMLREQKIDNIPIIVMTGEKNVETERQALEGGAWDFIIKPYDALILDIRLKNAIAKSQVEVYRKLNHMMEHDVLTGLHNRSKMFRSTQSMIENNPDKQFLFLKGDIDHFALYNTAYGEKEGDRLLIYFANLVRLYCEKHKPCTYGRINADVFCACIAWEGNYLALEEELRELQQRLDDFRQEYVLEISVGACAVERALTVDQLYFRAALGAKKCKYNYGVYFGVYDEAEVRQEEIAVQITNEMEQALETEQFAVYLQPKYQVREEILCGAEALVRWIHPEKGMIPPGRFIPVFEKNGFIGKLDYYMWEHTCQILAKWIKNGVTPVPVSVNVSRISLYNPKQDQELKNLVNQYQLSPSLLELEITESAYMTNPDLMREMLEKLHRAGFTILMDDFGSDYSSLNTLKNIDMDVLKIDMQFIPKEKEEGKGNIILSAVVNMAKALGMGVIAEGVETKAQRDFLANTPCDMIQGFYYSRPLPVNEFEKKYFGES